MSMILPDCSRERAIEVLGFIEGIAGYMALMIAADMVGSPEGEKTFDPAVFSIEGSRASEHPVHLALTMANELRNSFGLGLVAIGFIHARRVKVVSVSGMDQVRAANPGVRLIRAAMEECFDRRETVLSSSFPGDEVIEDDCRLHREWRESVGGDPVASFPLFLQDEIVAIVSVTNSLPSGLPADFIKVLATDMAKYGPILPLCRFATRGVAAHVWERIRRTKNDLLGTGRRRRLMNRVI